MSLRRRARDDEAFLTKTRLSFVGGDLAYGERRIWHDMLVEDVACGLHRVERIMRENAMRARPWRRRALPRDEGVRTVPTGPNRKWIADLMYIWTAEDWLYVAAVIDLCSRRVVGWSMQVSITAQVVADALLIAV